MRANDADTAGVRHRTGHQHRHARDGEMRSTDRYDRSGLAPLQDVQIFPIPAGGKILNEYACTSEAASGHGEFFSLVKAAAVVHHPFHMPEGGDGDAEPEREPDASHGLHGPCGVVEGLGLQPHDPGSMGPELAVCSST